MDKEQLRAARGRLVAQMEGGQPWHVAAAIAGLQTSQSTAYRLCQAVRERGEMALQDGRHGHLFPKNARRLLDDATSRHLLRVVGDGYSFADQSLFDYFASL